MRILFGLIAFLLLLNSCSGIKEVKLEQINTISNFQKNGKIISADVSLTIRNENSFPIVVKPSQLDVLLNNQSIGVISLRQKVKFNKKSTEKYEVPVSFENKGFQALDLLKIALSKQIELRFRGKLKAGNGIISKKFPVDKTQKIRVDDLMKWIK